MASYASISTAIASLGLILFKVKGRERKRRERERRLKINFNSILLSPSSRDCLFFLYTEQLMPQYIKDLDNKLHYARMGFALGLGALPKRILEGQLDTVNK